MGPELCVVSALLRFGAWKGLFVGGWLPTFRKALSSVHVLEQRAGAGGHPGDHTGVFGLAHLHGRDGWGCLGRLLMGSAAHSPGHLIGASHLAAWKDGVHCSSVTHKMSTASPTFLSTIDCDDESERPP